MRHVRFGPIAVLDGALLRDDALLLLHDALGLEIRFAEVLGLWRFLHGLGKRRLRAMPEARGSGGLRGRRSPPSSRSHRRPARSPRAAAATGPIEASSPRCRPSSTRPRPSVLSAAIAGRR